ncbi:YicC family protein [Clostridia bacterium]|nr:YicC family protein [Clostridia bacterium]
MVSSMTGFGVGEANGDGHIVTVEIKGVNSRFCEVKTRIPRKYSNFEEKINRKMKEKFARGYMEVFVNYKEMESTKKPLKVDKTLALAYHTILRELAVEMGNTEEIPVMEIARLPEVMVANDEVEDLEALWILTKMAFYDAIKEVKSMRADEGYNLKKDILDRVDILKSLTATVKQYSEENLVEYRNKLFERVETILDDVPINEDRLATELAIYADKSDITEETVRLDSHFKMMLDTLEDGGVVGRKLDFLVQEINREINTIGSKSHVSQISQTVVEMKSEVEKIREQIQNIE